MTSPRKSSRACRCSFATPRSRPASFVRCRRPTPCGRWMLVSGRFPGDSGERRLPSHVAVAHKDGGHGQRRRQGRAELAGVLLRGGLLERNDCIGEATGQHGLAFWEVRLLSSARIANCRSVDRGAAYSSRPGACLSCGKPL